jgi:hypothetical protein
VFDGAWARDCNTYVALFPPPCYYLICIPSATWRIKVLGKVHEPYCDRRSNCSNHRDWRDMCVSRKVNSILSRLLDQTDGTSRSVGALAVDNALECLILILLFFVLYYKPRITSEVGLQWRLVEYAKRRRFKAKFVQCLKGRPCERLHRLGVPSLAPLPRFRICHFWESTIVAMVINRQEKSLIGFWTFDWP